MVEVPRGPLDRGLHLQPVRGLVGAGGDVDVPVERVTLGGVLDPLLDPVALVDPDPVGVAPAVLRLGVLVLVQHALVATARAAGRSPDATGVTPVPADAERPTADVRDLETDHGRLCSRGGHRRSGRRRGGHDDREQSGEECGAQREHTDPLRRQPERGGRVGGCHSYLRVWRGRAAWMGCCNKRHWSLHVFPYLYIS